MMNWMNNGQGAWMMGGMGLLFILFWIVVIAAVVLIVRWLTTPNEQGKILPIESPLDILKKRYAKGEIDSGTFEKMQQDLAASERKR
ncbi:MAG: SHOCT domain-containing protein [Glaciimonas sp.]|nr:SHOCT domain-containing protein [Glaciimonas sp.]